MSKSAAWWDSNGDSSDEDDPASVTTPSKTEASSPAASASAADNRHKPTKLVESDEDCLEDSDEDDKGATGFGRTATNHLAAPTQLVQVPTTPGPSSPFAVNLPQPPIFSGPRVDHKHKCRLASVGPPIEGPGSDTCRKFRPAELVLDKIKLHCVVHYRMRQTFEYILEPPKDDGSCGIESYQCGICNRRFRNNPDKREFPGYGSIMCHLAVEHGLLYKAMKEDTEVDMTEVIGIISQVDEKFAEQVKNGLDDLPPIEKLIIAHEQFMWNKTKEEVLANQAAMQAARKQGRRGGHQPLAAAASAAATGTNMMTSDKLQQQPTNRANVGATEAAAAAAAAAPAAASVGGRRGRRASKLEAVASSAPTPLTPLTPPTPPTHAESALRVLRIPKLEITKCPHCDKLDNNKHGKSAVRLHICCHYRDYWAEALRRVTGSASGGGSKKDLLCELCSPAKRIMGATPESARNSFVIHLAIQHKQLEAALKQDTTGKVSADFISELFAEDDTAAAKPKSAAVKNEAAVGGQEHELQRQEQQQQQGRGVKSSAASKKRRDDDGEEANRARGQDAGDGPAQRRDGRGGGIRGRGEGERAEQRKRMALSDESDSDGGDSKVSAEADDDDDAGDEETTAQATIGGGGKRGGGSGGAASVSKRNGGGRRGGRGGAAAAGSQRLTRGP